MAGRVERANSASRLGTPLPLVGSYLSKWGLPVIIGIGIIFPHVAGNYWIDVAVFWGFTCSWLESEYYRR